MHNADISIILSQYQEIHDSFNIPASNLVLACPSICMKDFASHCPKYVYFDAI